MRHFRRVTTVVSSHDTRRDDTDSAQARQGGATTCRIELEVEVELGVLLQTQQTKLLLQLHTRGCDAKARVNGIEQPLDIQAARVSAGHHPVRRNRVLVLQRALQQLLSGKRYPSAIVRGATHRPIVLDTKQTIATIEIK